MHLTLTLKKVYFDEIARGEKTIEYRKISPYYTRLFVRTYDSVTFHYYRKETLKCKITKIEKIPNPFPDSTYLVGSEIYAIHLTCPLVQIRS
jgi:ASC-1-like (ASCH) protein